jgi:hypothetical protein
VSPRLKLVESTESIDDALRALLAERDECERRIAEIDREMLPYRKQYAAERGEFVPPDLPRLRREVLS